MRAIDVRFVESKKGMIALCNEGFIQQACLSKAQQAASIASGATGRAISCDVQPGLTMCHARASCAVPFDPPNEYYGGLRTGNTVKKALRNAAVSLGGNAMSD